MSDTMDEQHKGSSRGSSCNVVHLDVGWALSNLRMKRARHVFLHLLGLKLEPPLCLPLLCLPLHALQVCFRLTQNLDLGRNVLNRDFVFSVELS